MGNSIVVKIGGSTLGSHDTGLADLVMLQKRGVNPVIVHGGGGVVSEWMQCRNITPKFIRGLRVTDASSLQVVVAVLAGLVNKELVAKLITLGGRALGISGVDGALLQANVQDSDLGFVGKIASVDPAPILQAISGGYIPVVAPVGVHLLDGSPNSGCLLNINADTVAGHIAQALGASRLVFLTDVEGVMDSSGRLIRHIQLRQGRALLTSGTIKGGMLPKLEACLEAAAIGTQTNIIDGRDAGALIECLEGSMVGTKIGL